MSDLATSISVFPKRPTIQNPKFFKLLEARNIIEREFIRDLLDEFEGNALDVLATLIQSGVGTKRELCQLWCDSIGIAHVDLEKTLFQPHIVRKIPERFARNFFVIPIYRLGNMITVASATPENREIAATVEQLVGGPVSMVFALPQDIETAIENEYHTNSALLEFFNKITAGRIFRTGGAITAARLAKAAGKEAINQFHVALIIYAATENAYEIRLAAGADTAAVSLIDGHKNKQIELEKSIYEQLLLRLKALAGVDLTFDYRPQYGRILLPTPGKKFDIRFETVPAEHGETIILRLSHSRRIRKIRELNALNLSHRIREELSSRLRAPKGLFLVAGLPRSGKSALAYAILTELKKADIRIVTIEKEIKFLLPGIDQYQVNEPAGIHAADLLASCLKQHSQVIYLQEFEDPGIIRTASEAALSGQFVLAGINASNAPDAIEKVMQSGGGPAISAILTQHQAARLCDHCKHQFRLSRGQADLLFFGGGTDAVRAWREKGCPYCKGTGFAGIIGVHEFLAISNSLRKLIINRAPIAEIREAIGPEILYNMRHDGIKKVLRGLTTFDEIDRLPAFEGS